MGKYVEKTGATATPSELGTGTPDSTKFLRGDGAWAVPPSGGSPPTGTGFRHVTAGVEDAASKLVDTADISNDQVTYAKIQNVGANKILGSVAGGDVAELDCTAAGRALLDDADAAAQRTTLGLGNVVNSDTSTTANITDSANKRFVTDAQQTVIGNTSGVNTGDQVVPTTENIEDIVGAMVSGNTETGIAVTYDDTGAKLNFDAQTAGDARYAPIAAGVTNGNSHDHNGGDGAQINHTTLSNIGTNTHAQIDTHLASTSNPHNTSDANLVTTDVTTNNASTSKHGFLQKLPGGTATFLRADGAFASPTAAASISQTEIDFGATPVAEASFLITDAAVSPSSRIIGNVAYVAPTGKDLDEIEMDGLDLKFAPGSGQFTLYARGLDGYIADRFVINYQVGA